jgi:outer membrane protein insertion porin family
MSSSCESTLPPMGWPVGWIVTITSSIAIAWMAAPSYGQTPGQLSPDSPASQLPADATPVELGPLPMPLMPTAEGDSEAQDAIALPLDRPSAQPMDDLDGASLQASDLGVMEVTTTSRPAIAQFSGGGGPGPLRFYLGTELAYPTGLFGPTRRFAVPAASDRQGGLSLPGGVQLTLSDTDTLTLEGRVGTSILGADLSYRHTPNRAPLGFGVNLFNQRAYSSNLRGGDREVDLPGGDTPWVHRLGIGAEIFHAFTPELDGALGLTYQRVSVRDDVFSNSLFSRDELGNRLTIRDSGQDDWLVFSAAAQYDDRNDGINPTEGTRLRLGLEQAFGLQGSGIGYTGLTGNATRYIPLSLFDVADGPQTLVLNVQAGHLFNDVPSYRAFSLGGSNSVRGFDRGEVGSSTSFVQATAEYRFPLFSFDAFDDVLDVGGLLFIDYANALGTQGDVIGRPGEVRDKPGDGLGFGLGLRLLSPFGPVRVEAGFTNRGDSAIHINLGDRF